MSVFDDELKDNPISSHGGTPSEVATAAMERRLVHRLLNLWRDATTFGRLPSLKAIDTRELNTVSKNVYLLVVQGDGDEPVFMRIGTAFAEQPRAMLLGQPVSAAWSGTLLCEASRHYPSVLRRRVPIIVGNSFRQASGCLVLFRSAILPVAEDGSIINALLCGANSKVEDHKD
jgi:hypothetical protein